MGLLDGLFGRGQTPSVTLGTAPPEETYIRAELDGTSVPCGWASSPDGEWMGLYTCTDPRRVALLYREEGQFMREFDGVNAIAVANGGRLAVAEDHDADGGTLHVFGPEGHGKVERSYDRNLGDCALDPDGRHAAVVVSPSTVRVLDVDTGDQLTSVDSPAAYPTVEFDGGDVLRVDLYDSGADDTPVETVPLDGS